MKKFVSVLFILTLLISAQLWARSTSLGTGCEASHALAINENGTVYAWGYNYAGQLGNNSPFDSQFPVAVDTSGVLSGKTIMAVATGQEFSLALDSDGKVYSWGKNPGAPNSSVPIAVDMSGVLSGKTITAISAGQKHVVVLASDGTVYAWGNNSKGQLGDNSTTESELPVAVDMSGVLSGKTITSIATGVYHSVALASDGTAYAWGYNPWGQLGNNLTSNPHVDSSVPVAVDMSGVLSGKTITAIAAGGHHTIALASDSKVYAWGLNNYGQIGYNSPLCDRPMLVDTSGVLSGKTITAVAGGTSHTFVLDSDGIIYAWGYNNRGQLGNGLSGTYEMSSVPVAVDMSGVLSGKTITAIAAGGAHTVAMASDGNVYTWGYNGKGQLGNNTLNNSSYPVKVINSDNSDFFVPVKDVPQEFALNANYPNPFNPSTTISFQLSVMSDVKLTIYDMNGKIVSTLINDFMPAGYHETNWDASDLSSGIYFYCLQAGDYVATKKMIFMK